MESQIEAFENFGKAAQARVHPQPFPHETFNVPGGYPSTTCARS